ITELLKERQRWINDARTGAIGTGDLLLDRLNDFVPVPGLLGDEGHDDQAEVSVGEEPAKASPATVPTMAKALAVMILFSAVEAAAAVFVTGMPVIHLDSEYV